MEMQLRGLLPGPTLRRPLLLGTKMLWGSKNSTTTITPAPCGHPAAYWERAMRDSHSLGGMSDTNTLRGHAAGRMGSDTEGSEGHGQVTSNNTSVGGCAWGPGLRAWEPKLANRWVPMTPPTPAQNSGHDCSLCSGSLRVTFATSQAHRLETSRLNTICTRCHTPTQCRCNHDSGYATENLCSEHLCSDYGPSVVLNPPKLSRGGGFWLAPASAIPQGH